MEQYLEHSKIILSDKYSYFKPNRTSVDSVARFGYLNEYDLDEGFPLVTSKQMYIKGIIHELLWFLKGDTNIKHLVDNNVHIWDYNAFQFHLKNQKLEEKFPVYSEQWHKSEKEFIQRIKEDTKFAEEHGDLGDIYGKQWRSWKTSDGKELDQFSDVLEIANKNPNSRRLIVQTWNPEIVGKVSLEPCHKDFQLDIADGRLDIAMNQRSCDMFLGVPYNIASYSMLTIICAQHLNLQPGRFIHELRNAHFYCGRHERGQWYKDNTTQLKFKVKYTQEKEEHLETLQWIIQNAPPERGGEEGLDHITGILEQLAKEPKPLPRLEIAKKPFDQLTINDFTLHNYESHPKIERQMPV